MTVSKKELVSECAELRVEVSELKKVIKDFHTIFPENFYEDEEETEYFFPEKNLTFGGKL